MLNKKIAESNTIPKFFTRGMAYLLPTTTGPNPNRDQYIPLTCLIALYKLFTAILCNKMYEHVVKYRIRIGGQKGCQRNSYGCKEQISIDSLVTQHAKKTKKNLFW